MTALLRALPEVLSAATILWIWNEPLALGIEGFRGGVFALMLEFFVIHAGGFMAVTVTDPRATARRRLLRLFGWSAGYLLFVSIFAWGFQAWWMVGAFAWFCFSKLQAIWTADAPTERDRTHAIVAWALSVVVFLGSVGVTAAFEVPMLGAIPQVRDAAGFDAAGGLWESEPHRALAGAVLYFAIMGLCRPLLARAFDAHPARP